MPDPAAPSLQVAYRKAVRELIRRDLQEVCRRCGAELRGGRIVLRFFGLPVEIRPPGSGGAEEEAWFSPPEPPLVEKILILHYLLAAGGRGRTEKMVSFKQLPGASFYEPAYRRRGPQRIERRFGSDLELFRRACRVLAWEEGELGDASCSIEVFPRLKAMVVLHRGDEEFPPEATLLFSGEIADWLPLEDVAVLSGLIASRLIKAA